MGLLHAEITSGHAARQVQERVEVMANHLGRLPATSLIASRAEDVGVSCVIATQAEEPGSAVAAKPGTAIAADIRLDNREDFAARLGLAGARVSDAALVMEGYRRWGLSVASSILGDGVFLLWDGQRRRFVAWRDVAGTRPLYYRQTEGGGLVVSSDLRALVVHPAVGARLDLAYVNALLRNGLGFSHPTRTLCHHVRKLPSAHLLVLDEQGLRLQRHWTADDIPERRYADTSDYVDELKALLGEAVQARVGGGSELIASHLSGGLDSSSVAVVANRIASRQGRHVIGSSWAPPMDVLPPIDEDERPLVKAVAEAEQIDARYTRLDAADLNDLNTRDLALRPATTLSFELGASRALAAEGVRTILSGWGGDELVVNNGKGYFADLARRGRWLTLRRELRMRAEIHPSSMASLLRGRVLLPILPDQLLFRLRPEERPVLPDLPRCLRPEFAAELEQTEPLGWPLLRERPGVRRYQIAKFESGHLQYRMESWFAHGIDLGIRYQYPLLDRRLIEFALSIPDHLYFKNGWKRWLYRTAMEGTLPTSVRWHPHKRDFAMLAQGQRVAEENAAAWREILRSRGANNAYIDIGEYFAPASDDGSNGHSAGPASNGNAAWLPFTSLSMP